LFDKAIELNPRRMVHHVEMGRTHIKMGDHQKARACLEHAMQLEVRENPAGDQGSYPMRAERVHGPSLTVFNACCRNPSRPPFPPASSEREEGAGRRWRT
jgi:hypothetical protein